jgi:hypothetical protein
MVALAESYTGAVAATTSGAALLVFLTTTGAFSSSESSSLLLSYELMTFSEINLQGSGILMSTYRAN